METQEYIFWLTYKGYRIQVFRAAWPKKRFILCRVTSTRMELQDTDAESEKIPFTAIESCEKDIIRTESITDDYARIHLNGATTTIRLKAADVLYRKDSQAETYNLVDVINALRKGERPSIHHNPYYREFERRRRLSEFIPGE